MRKKQNYIIRLGLFVTIAISLLIVGSYYIGNNQNLFRSTFTISSFFNNVNGLRSGNNVHYAGIKIGTVEKIEIINDSTLRVDMMVEENVQPYIHKNAVASIATDGLVGNMLVNISPGKGLAPSVEDGDVLESYSRLKTDELLNTLGKTNENLAVLSNDLLTITNRIVNGQGTIAMLLSDSIMARELQQSMTNLRTTTAYLNNTTLRLNKVATEIESGEGLLGSLIRDTTVMQELQRFVSKIEGLEVEKVDSLLVQLDRSGKDIVVFSNNLRELSQRFEEEDNLVHSLTQDSTIATDIESLIHNLNTGSEMLNENLKAMRQNFLFRKYFRDQEREEKEEKMEQANH